MAGNPLTQQVAEKALQKLAAQDVTRKGDAHPRFAVFHNGNVVAITGLRHSPKKDMLVPHVKNDLRVNTAFVLELARCTKYLPDWLLAVGITALENDEQEEPDVTAE